MANWPIASWGSSPGPPMLEPVRHPQLDSSRASRGRAPARARLHEGGFTVVEILVVMVILGVLTAILAYAGR